MPNRLKVLMSAYACEPGKGSEQEVGWQWALQMARFHDVTVLTRANNRPVIEPALQQLAGKQPLPEFVYHDRGAPLLEFKREFKTVKLYYLLWQRSARELIEHLHAAHHYDLMHHVTFAAFRYPIAIWGHGAPCIWGPVGGIESIPQRLMPWHHPVSLAHEAARNAHNLIQATPFHVLPRRARASTLILASTREMKRTFARLGFEVELMPTIGLKSAEMPCPPRTRAGGPLKLLFVGNIITLKGVDLALEALKRADIKATFTLIGDGNYLRAAQALTANLGLQDRVNFLGRLPRDQVLKLYADYDIFLFPSLHDTGGYAVIEAMFNRLPVICLDCGGPAVAVGEGCGIRVPVGRRAEVLRNLAAALRSYEQNPAQLGQHGDAARERVLRHYDWDRKGEEMNRCYEAALTHAAANHRTANRPMGYSSMGGLTNLLHQIFSLQGALTALVGLFLIGALGFASLSRLKTQARNIVDDTLPGLSFAGEANANLAQAFNHTLLLLVADAPAERQQLRKEIDGYTRITTNYLSAYRRQIFTSADQNLFERLLQARAEYISVRQRTFDLVESNQRAKAIAQCQAELLPAYQRYKEAGDRLFLFNMRQGETRGRTILAVCTGTQFLVAFIGVAVFIVGFIIGMFK